MQWNADHGMKCEMHSASGPVAAPPQPAVQEHCNISSCIKKEEHFICFHYTGLLYTIAL